MLLSLSLLSCIFRIPDPHGCIPSSYLTGLSVMYVLAVVWSTLLSHLMHSLLSSVISRIFYRNGAPVRYIDTIRLRAPNVRHPSLLPRSFVDDDALVLCRASLLARYITCFILYLSPPSPILSLALLDHHPRYSSVYAQCRNQFPDRGHRVSSSSDEK
jgi:hypothetical protein